jgi:endonuclease III
MAGCGQLENSKFLQAIDELLNFYHGFSWESQIWEACNGRRSPYRVLILFGLSSRTKDQLLVETCRRFFRRFPGPEAMVDGWFHHRAVMESIVRKGQLPFLESAAGALCQHGGAVPSEREALLKIKGVGEKIAECVLGYGWGREALPMDGNGCRVVMRFVGLTSPEQRPDAAHIRNGLKNMFGGHREWMSSRKVAMVDLHEALRLHGQVVCKRSPQCSRCPIIGCRSRKQDYSPFVGAGFPVNLWEEWRELILDPPNPEPATRDGRAVR